LPFDAWSQGPGYRAPRYEDILEEYKNTWKKQVLSAKSWEKLNTSIFLIDALAQSKKKTALTVRTKIDNLRTSWIK
jgi:hypothetical protein